MVHASTQLTPFELDLGNHPKTPYSYLSNDVLAPKTVEDFVDALEALQNQAIDYLERARHKPKKSTKVVSDLKS
jgi:hypothetical protein